MRNLLRIFPVVILIAACSQNDPEEVKKEDVKTQEQETKPEKVTQVETLFDESTFSDPKHLELLKELDVCAVNDSTAMCAPCSPSNFKLYPLKKDANISDAFMLQIKALTVMKGQQVPLPVRHLILFEREAGELVKVNGFRGNLVEMREAGSEAKDLVIRFYLPEDETFFNCLFKWNGGQYSFDSVEGIDWGEGTKRVKAEHKESTSKEIYSALMNNSLIF